MNPSLHHALTQADGIDNIAPTLLQGHQAWQYAQTDSFFSPEEQTAVLQQPIDLNQPDLLNKLALLGLTADVLEQFPDMKVALFSGQSTSVMRVAIAPDVWIEGRLRIQMTEAGPDIRITPAFRELTIPGEVASIRLSDWEKQELMQSGALSRPMLLPDNGNYVPTFLRVDRETNTLELWRVRADELPRQLMGVDLTRDQQLQLANGHAVRLTGLLDRKGEPFDATVSISASRKELTLSDMNRLDLVVKPDNRHREQLALNDDGGKTDQTRQQELTTGQTVVTNQEREMMRQFLDDKPEQRLSTPKQRLS